MNSCWLGNLLKSIDNVPAEVLLVLPMWYDASLGYQCRIPLYKRFLRILAKEERESHNSVISGNDLFFFFPILLISNISIQIIGMSFVNKYYE